MNFISYDTMHNMSPFRHFRAILSHFMQKSQETVNIGHIRICLCIGVELCTVMVRKLSKDIMNYVKLNRSTICKLCAK